MGRKEKTPWDYIQDRDRKRLGSIIDDKDEQKRWGTAVFLAGTLPYIWDMAKDFKKLMYDALNLAKGDKVLIVGEALDTCGFVKEVRNRIGNEGEIVEFEIIEEGRNRLEAGEVMKWRYQYGARYSDEYFDAIFLPQGIHHAEDWPQAAKDFVRVLKKGKRLVAAEVTLGSPEFLAAINSHVRIGAIFKKIQAAVGIKEWHHVCQTELEKAFASLLNAIHTFAWKGMLLFHGTKK